MDAETYPRWAIEDYPDAIKDLTKWLIEANCKAVNIDRFKDDKEAYLRLMVQVRAKVLAKTRGMVDLAERAELYQLWEAKKEGWFTFLPGEYTNMEEFLASINDPDAKPNSMDSDLAWLTGSLFPLMEANGMNTEQMLSRASGSKLRAGIPSMKTVMEEKTGQDLVDALTAILNDIMDPKISWRAFREKLPRYKGKSYDSIWADVYNFQHYSMIVIRDDTGGPLMKHIQRKLGSTIEFRGAKDPLDLLKELTDELMGEDDND